MENKKEVKAVVASTDVEPAVEIKTAAKVVAEEKAVKATDTKTTSKATAKKIVKKATTAKETVAKATVKKPATKNKKEEKRVSLYVQY